MDIWKSLAKQTFGYVEAEAALRGCALEAEAALRGCANNSDTGAHSDRESYEGCYYVFLDSLWHY
jgi:hypothetical protein